MTLVARRGHRLEALATELRAAHRGHVHVLVADLETARGRGAVTGVLEERSPWLLVNNAGFGSHGTLAGIDPRRERAEVQVNVVAVQQLSLAVLPGLVEAGAGGILNVASMAGFQPLPYMATYAATKAFVLAFTEALAEELRGTGARAMALCPGPVTTEFGELAGVERHFRLSRPMNMTAPQCIRAALRAFDRGSALCVPGVLNSAIAQTSQLAPRVAVRRLTGRFFRMGS